jgi:hypothetical protein
MIKMIRIDADRCSGVSIRFLQPSACEASVANF